MNLSDNEKYLRDLLGDGTEDLDMEALWDAVEPRLDKKRKRRGIIFWFFGAGLLFSILGITFTLWCQTEETASNDTTTPNINQHAESDPIGKHDLNTSFSGDENVVVNGNTKGEDDGIDLLTNNSEHKVYETKTSPSLSVNKYDINFYNLNQENISNHLSQITETIVSSDVVNDEEGIKNELKDNVEDVIMDEIKKEDDENAKEKDSEELTEEKELKKKKKERTRKKRKKRKKWSPYFYSTASLAYPARILTAQDNNDARELLLIKKEYEKSLESYQFGVNFKFIHKKKNLILNVGANYENITERLKYQEETIEVESQSVTESIIVDAEGNLIAQEVGMAEITTITKRDVSIYNHYRFLNLQLGTGYRIENRKFNVECEAGLDLNLFFKAKGHTFNKDLQVISLNQIMKKNAVKPSLWLSLTLDYPLNKKVSFVGSGYLKYRPGSVTKKTYDVKHKFFSPGISGGMKFLIF